MVQENNPSVTTGIGISGGTIGIDRAKKKEEKANMFTKT